MGVLAVIAVLTLCVAIFNWNYHRQVQEHLYRIEEKETTHMITTEWTSGSNKRTWTSIWREHDENETFDDFLDRHANEVRLAKIKFPEDS